MHVARSDGLTGADPAELATQRQLVESLGGSYHCVVGDDIPTALLDFAQAQTEASGDIDVHLVTHRYAGQGPPLPPPRTDLLPRRALAWGAAWIVPPVVTAILTQLRGELNLTSQVLLFLLVVVGIARIGGLAPALLAAVSSSLLLNYYFIAPIHTLTIAEPNNVIALVVFVLVALTVASVVDVAVRHTQRAARRHGLGAHLAGQHGI